MEDIVFKYTLINRATSAGWRCWCYAPSTDLWYWSIRLDDRSLALPSTVRATIDLCNKNAVSTVHFFRSATWSGLLTQSIQSACRKAVRRSVSVDDRVCVCRSHSDHGRWWRQRTIACNIGCNCSVSARQCGNDITERRLILILIVSRGYNSKNC